MHPLRLCIVIYSVIPLDAAGYIYILGDAICYFLFIFAVLSEFDHS